MIINLDNCTRGGPDPPWGVRTILNILALAAGSALAATGGADASTNDIDADQIIVTGTRYAPPATSSATRTDTPLKDVPQAVSLVTKQQIEDAALRSIGDVLRYVPGALIGQGEGHRDQVTLRGNGSTADFFVDGLRDDVQYYRGLYNVERVEVLKGPNAMIFGRGGGGGVVNRVSKRPFDGRLIAGAVSLDSFGSHFVEADVNLPLISFVAARVNAVYEAFNNHRDAYGGDRLAINPMLDIDIGPDTRAGLSYEYAQDDRVVDRGVPSLAGRPLESFRDAFFGARSVNDSEFDAHVVRADLLHRFSDALSFNGKLLYGRYNKSYQNAFAATAVTTNAAGTPQVGVEAYRDATRRENLFVQNDLVWRVDTGGIGHVLLAGIEYGDQSTRNERVNGFFDGPVTTTSNRRRTAVDLTDPLLVPDVTFRAGAGNRSVRSEADVLAVYAQDQLSIGEGVELVAGIRYDRFRLEVADQLTGAAFVRTDDLWSPRLGLVLKPVAPVSLYASYSRSYLPQSGDQFLSLDASLETLEPERFDNYEVGAKWEPRPGLLVTAAAYRLDRVNSRAPGSVAGTTVLTGAQRSEGVELSASGRILPRWTVSAGYALQDAEIRKAASGAPAGRDVPLVPRHQASLWTRYDAGDRLGLGLGVYHQSRVFASISNAVTLPRYTRVDGALFFRVGKGVEAQVNVENLLGEDYFPTAHNDNNITTGAPRNVRGTLRFQF
ncbi:MAG TPA: TonB-dependent siderophore receptor [Sphingomonadaceae bacterium]|nr:TonB-dependent siderophore receptor [Sphingomonadaceae bacterium]